MKRLILLAPALALTLQGCGPMLGAALGGIASPPPQAPAQVTQISRTALTFALHSFDAALYGLDWGMDAGRIVPGSDQARSIARTGRSVMNFLGVADAAQRLGNSASYEEAFANATRALGEFRQLAGMSPQPAALQDGLPPMTDAERFRIIERLERAQTI